MNEGREKKKSRQEKKRNGQLKRERKKEGRKERVSRAAFHSIRTTDRHSPRGSPENVTDRPRHAEEEEKMEGRVRRVLGLERNGRQEKATERK